MKFFHTIILSALLTLSSLAHADGVNINTADAATLQQALNGVGQVRAEAIVEYREKNGPFQHLDDITNVDGIGKATLDLNRENMRLN